MRGDASFSAVFTGLTDGESYFAKAQVKLDTLESSIVAKDDANVPSSKPSLDSNLGNKVEYFRCNRRYNFGRKY